MRDVSPVRSTTTLGAFVCVIALACGAIAGGLLRRASVLPAPDLPPGRRVPGVVVGVTASPCQTRPRGQTCARPVVRYTADGVTAELVSRDAYTPNPYPEGAAVDVALLPDGPWLAPERDARIAAAADLVAQSRRRHRIFAAIFGVCAAACGLLGAGMIWFVDRSPDPA